MLKIKGFITEIRKIYRWLTWTGQVYETMDWRKMRLKKILLQVKERPVSPSKSFTLDEISEVLTLW